MFIKIATTFRKLQIIRSLLPTTVGKFNIRKEMDEYTLFCNEMNWQKWEKCKEIWIDKPTQVSDEWWNAEELQKKNVAV